MNGVCLLDRYLTVRTVSQRRSTSVSLSSVEKLSVVGANSGTKAVDDDNPFYSSSKPITRLELIPTAIEKLNALSQAATHETNGSDKMVDNDNPFLTPSKPMTRSVSSEASTSLPSFSQAPATVQSALSLGNTPSIQGPPSLLSTPSIHSTPPPPLFNTPPPLLFSVLPPPPPPPHLLSLNPFFHDPRCIPPPPSLPTPPPLPPQPLFPSQSNSYGPNSHSQSVPGSPSLSYEPDPRIDFAPYNGRCSPLIQNEQMNGHEALHQTRLHANDHPAWLTSETKEKLNHYHLDALEKSLENLKKSLNNRQSC